MKIKRRHFLPLAGSALASAAFAASRDAGLNRDTRDSSPAENGGLGKRMAPTLPKIEITLTGPSSGLERALSGVFIVAHTGALKGRIKITPTDGADGQFWPLSYAEDKALILNPATQSAAFFYAPGSSGPKTITLTNNAGLSNPSSKSYTAMPSEQGSATPFRLVRAGTTIGSYATLQKCKDIGGWQSGDVVKCTGGIYIVDNVNAPGNTEIVFTTGGIQYGVEVDTLTIEWETPGIPMVLDFSKRFQISMWTGGQPQLLTMGIHWRGARPAIGASWFGAAIWTTLSGAPGNATLTLEYCKISECPDGIKTQDGRRDLSTYVRYCVFEDNSDNRGLDHDIYTGQNALTYVLGCSFRKTADNPYPQDGMGHFIKSRCRETTVLACLFNGYMDTSGYGGVAQTINTPNGGIVKIAGNVTLYYGAKNYQSMGNPLRYGEDQHSRTVDTNLDPALTTHSLLYAQNTVRMALGRPDDGNYESLLSIFPAGKATTLLCGSLAQIPVTATVRNNIVANDTPAMAIFLKNYPNNTQKQLSQISDTGDITSAQIAGNPALNDALYEWAGDFRVPTPRTDTHRGGRSTYIPGWVPPKAWQWVNVGTNSTWTSYVKNNGSGIVPALLPDEPSYQKSYAAQWDYSAPAYSRKHHEIWMFGGGHKATTINLVTKWNLHKETPDVSVACKATTHAIRKANLLAFASTQGDNKVCFPDGKPYSPHSYTNSQYSDATDEFISFGLGFMMSPGANFDGAGGGWSSNAIPALQRTGDWRPDGYYPSSKASNEADLNPANGPRFMSADGMTIYYWLDSNAGNGLYKFDLASKRHTAIGGGLPPAGARHADEGNGRALILDRTHNGETWLAKFVNLSTGVLTSVTIGGDVLPGGMSIYDLAWCPDKGYYVSVWFNRTAMYNSGATINAITVATITPTDPSKATASVKAMTGIGPSRFGAFRGAFYDPTYGCMIVVTHHSDPVKAFKIA
jgi:hypothetical protein